MVYKNIYSLTYVSILLQVAWELYLLRMTPLVLGMLDKNLLQQAIEPIEPGDYLGIFYVQLQSLKTL
jgi:hypothetical protein